MPIVVSLNIAFADATVEKAGITFQGMQFDAIISPFIMK